MKRVLWVAMLVLAGCSSLPGPAPIRFSDQSTAAGVADPGVNSTGPTFADFDSDGDMDLYVSTEAQLPGQGSRLYRNDGWLDIYVNNGGLSDTLVNDVLGLPRSAQFYIAWEPALNRLYRNRGDRTFEDVTTGSGAEGIGSGVGWADVNDDGFADLFVANRTYYSQGRQVGEPGQNRLYVNRGNRNGWIRVLLQGSKGNRDGYDISQTRTWRAVIEPISSFFP